MSGWGDGPWGLIPWGGGPFLNPTDITYKRAGHQDIHKRAGHAGIHKTAGREPFISIRASHRGPKHLRAGIRRSYRRHAGRSTIIRKRGTA